MQAKYFHSTRFHKNDGCGNGCFLSRRSALRGKAKAFLAAVPEWTDYRASFKGLSLDDM